MNFLFRATQRLPQRLVIGLGLEIPQRHVQRGDGIVGQPVVAALEMLVNHPFPQALYPSRVLPHEQLIDHVLHLRPHATGP